MEKELLMDKKDKEIIELNKTLLSIFFVYHDTRLSEKEKFKKIGEILRKFS